MENISQYISYKEAVHSDTARRKGIRNTPNEQQLEAMKLLANKVFEPLRKFIGEPIRVNSFFRSITLNRLIGGSSTSQHTKGEAIDLDAMNGGTNKTLFDYIRDHLEYDQLIWEFGTDNEPDWIHVSYTSTRPNRYQMLRATRKQGKTIYTIMGQPSISINAETEGRVNVRRILNVRKEASVKTEKIGELYNGERVIILKEKSGWLKIKTQQLSGWVYGRYVKRL